MKKIASVLAVVLSFSLNISNAQQDQQQSGPTPGQIFGAFGALIDAANGNHHDAWGQHPQGGHNNGWDNGHPGQPGHHDGPGPQPGPWHPQPNPYPGPWHPQPGPQFGQMQKMNSIGSYSTSSDAEAAKNNAVRALGELRLPVMEARVEYNSGYRFVITYSAREPLAVIKYQGGTYSTSSDARQAADQTAAALKARGNKVILETPVYYNSGYTYTIGYVGLDHYQDPDDQQQTYHSIGSYSASSEASSARDAAVSVLKGWNITVLEARVLYNSGYRFVITYALRETLPVEQYRGGSYSTSSDARNAANRTAETLKARGKAVLETPVFYNSGYTYIVGYVTVNQGHHQTDQLQTLNSIGAYSTSGEASAAKDAASAALGELRLTVLEARVEYNSGYRFVINYNARQPLNLERYNGGTYSTSSAARQAADQTIAAMRSQGNIVVLEAPVYYNSGYTYSVSYVTRRW